MKYSYDEEDWGGGVLAKKLIIEKCSESEAYNLSQFVQAGCLLGYPSISDYPEPRFPLEYDFVLESRKISKEAEIKTFNYYYADKPIRSNLLIG